MLHKLTVKQLEDGQLAIFAQVKNEDAKTAYLAPIEPSINYQILRDGEEPAPTVVCDVETAMMVMKALQERLGTEEQPQDSGYSLEDIHKRDTGEIMFLRSVIGMLLTKKEPGANG
jgi:hypothetical protein